ncbi:MAG TPA: Rap1a/Tai family immunity protein [Phenylobacterium sp.]|nr:Rap1a/Tai family immunity protein [Phenylobacterium sp.]
MSLVFVLALAVAPAPPPGPAMSGFLDAQQLRNLCLADQIDPSTRRALCLGYIAGAVDQLLVRAASRPTTRREFCVPRGATVEEVGTVILHRLSRPQDLTGISAASAIRSALHAEYPCPPSRFDRP